MFAPSDPRGGDSFVFPKKRKEKKRGGNTVVHIRGIELNTQPTFE